MISKIVGLLYNPCGGYKVNFDKIKKCAANCVYGRVLRYQTPTAR